MKISAVEVIRAPAFQPTSGVGGLIGRRRRTSIEKIEKEAEE